MTNVRQQLSNLEAEDIVDRFEEDFVRNSLISVLSVLVFWLFILIVEIVRFDIGVMTLFIGTTVISGVVGSVFAIPTLRKYSGSELYTRLEVLYPFSIVWTVSSIIITFIPTAFLFGEFFWESSWYHPTIAGGIILSGLTVAILTNIYCILVSRVIQKTTENDLVVDDEENRLDKFTSDSETVEEESQPEIDTDDAPALEE